MDFRVGKWQGTPLNWDASLRLEEGGADNERAQVRASTG